MVKRKEISAMLLLFQNNAIMPMMPSWRLSLPAGTIGRIILTLIRQITSSKRR